MKITVMSAHEGSNAFRGWIRAIGENVGEIDFLNLLSDDEYRTTQRFRRLLNRVKVFLLFPLIIIFQRARISNSDVILVNTSPFYAPWIVCFLYPNIKTVILHNDIYPEAFKAILGLKETSIFFKFIIYMDRNIEQKVDGNVYISKDHFNIRAHLATEPIQLNTPGFRSDFRKDPVQPSKPIKFIYSGTLNSLHWSKSTKTMLFELAQQPGVEIDFYISGSMRGQLAFDMAGSDNISFYAPLSGDKYIQNMLSYDFGLILLNEYSASSIFPSKLPGHLSVGQPLVILSPKKNSLTDFISLNSCGYFLTMDQTSNVNIIDQILSSPYTELCENSKKAFDKYFCPDMLSKNFVSYLRDKVV